MKGTALKKIQPSPWFNTEAVGLPRRAGIYEVSLSKRPRDTLHEERVVRLRWNGSRWSSVCSTNGSEDDFSGRVRHWRGVIPDANYPFDQVQPPPEPPSLASLSSVVQHIEWSDFHEDFGTAAPVRLILEDLLAYLDRLSDYIVGSPTLSDAISDDLDELSLSINLVKDDLDLTPATELGLPVDPEARQFEELEYVESVHQSVDNLSELLSLVWDSVPTEDEQAGLPPSERAATRNVSDGLQHVARLLTRLHEEA